MKGVQTNLHSTLVLLMALDSDGGYREFIAFTFYFSSINGARGDIND